MKDIKSLYLFFLQRESRLYNKILSDNKDGYEGIHRTVGKDANFDRLEMRVWVHVTFLSLGIKYYEYCKKNKKLRHRGTI